MAYNLASLGSDKECIKVYNPAKQELIGTYETYAKAQVATGITDRILKVMAVKKQRRFSPALNMEIAVRVKLMTAEEEKTLRTRNKYDKYE